MAIRIYALAKELRKDSRMIVEIAIRAGVPGKGSALASLEDDEVVKIRDYLRSHPEIDAELTEKDRQQEAARLAQITWMGKPRFTPEDFF